MAKDRKKAASRIGRNPSAPKEAQAAKRPTRVGTLSPGTPAMLFCVFFAFALWFWSVQYVDLVYLSARYDSLAIPGRAALGEFCDLCALGSALRVIRGFFAACGTCPRIGGAFWALAALGPSLLLWRLRPDLSRRGPIRFLASFLPAALMIFLPPYLGYYAFSGAPIPFFAAFLIGLTLMLGVGALVRRIDSDRTRIFVALAAIAALYPLFGFFALGAGVFAAHEELRRRRLRDAGILLAAILLTPWCWYPLFAARTLPSELYTVGFIPQPLLTLDRTTRTTMYSLLILSSVLTFLPVFETLFCLRHSVFSHSFSGQLHSPESLESGQQKNSPGMLETASAPESKRGATFGDLCALGGLFLLCGAVTFFARSEENYLATLALVRPLERGDWERVLEIEARTLQPTLPMIEARRLALFKTGRASEEFFSRPYRPEVREDLVLISTFRIFGPTLLFRYGCVNLAVRTAMNGLVLSGDRSPYYAAHLCRCALTEGEFVLAEKYIAWMKRRFALSATADAASGALAELRDGQKAAGEAAQWVAEIQVARSLKPTADYVDFNNQVTVAVCYASTHLTTTDLPLDMEEMRLIHFMQMADMRRFTEAFPAYVERLNRERPGTPIPPVLQEGALFADYYESKGGPLTRWPYTPELKERFLQFIRVTKRGETSPAAYAESRQILDTEYDDTWWNYYAHISNNPMY